MTHVLVCWIVVARVATGKGPKGHPSDHPMFKGKQRKAKGNQTNHRKFSLLLTPQSPKPGISRSICLQGDVPITILIEDTLAHACPKARHGEAKGGRFGYGSKPRTPSEHPNPH